MHFIIQPDQLKTAFSAVKTVAARTNALPVLNNILFRPSPDGQHFLLTCGDGDKAVTLPLPVEEPADLRPFLFPFSSLNDFVSNALDSWPVEVEVSEQGEIIISDMLGDFHCMGITDVSEYPVMPEISNPVVHTVQAITLCNATSAASGYVADDALRPYLGGIAFDFRADELRIVASDTKKLFCETIPGVPSSAGNEKVLVVPAKMASRLAAIFSTGKDDTIDVSFNARQVCFRQGDTTLQGTLIEGKYPRYEAVIPKNNHIFVTIDRAQLTAAIKRASIACNSVTEQIALDFDGRESLVISASDIDYSVSSSVKIKTVSQNDSPICIGARSSFVREAISTVGDNAVTFSMSAPVRPMIVQGVQNPNRLVLVMPIMLT